MYKYLSAIFDYWQEKIIVGLWAAVWTDNAIMLFMLFLGLECMDIFTRWLALSRQCHGAIYPQSPCSLWRAFTFMWQARKWRFIRSTGLRDGFCDKMLTYMLLLMLALMVDGALAIAHVPAVLLTIVTTVLSTTEALSVLENLSECGVGVIAEIKNKFKETIKMR